MLTRWLLSAALFFFASPALSQSWNRAASGSGVSTTSVAPTSGQQNAYYIVAAGASTDSSPLATAACSSVTVEMVRTSGGTADTGKAYIRTVDTQGATCSSGRKVLADIDGGGIDDITLNGDHGADEDVDGTSEGRAFLWGFGPIPYICVDMTEAPEVTGAYFVVTCGQ